MPHISHVLEAHLVFRPVLAVPVQLAAASSHGEVGQVPRPGLSTHSHPNLASTNPSGRASQRPIPAKTTSSNKIILLGFQGNATFVADRDTRRRSASRSQEE